MAFKDENWRPGSIRRLLCTIALSDPDNRRDTSYSSAPGSSVTLRFCDIPAEQGSFTYSSNVYTPAILGWSGSAASVDFLGNNSDAFGTLVLANVRVPFQKVHATAGAGAESALHYVKLSQLLADYVWSGAAVTMTMYCRSAASETTQTVFVGVVHEPLCTSKRVTLRVIQDKTAVRLKPDAEGPGSSTYPSVIYRQAYTAAPESSIGKILPIPYSHPDTAPIIEAQYGLCVNPMNVLGAYPVPAYYERFDGTYNGKFMLGAYPTQTAPGAGSTEILQWHQSANTFGVFTSGGISVTKNATETYVQVEADATEDIYLNPSDWVAGSTGITDAGKAFDGKDDTYAVVAYSGSARQLDLRINYPSPLGRITGSYVWVLLASGGTGVGGADSDVNGTYGIWNPDAGPAAYHFGVSGNITKANIRDGAFLSTDLTASTWETAEWQSWKWEGRDASGNRQDLYWRIDITSSGASARVIACGLRVRFIPENIFRNKPPLGTLYPGQYARLRGISGL